MPQTIISSDNSVIGTIKSSMLTLAQFQTLNGTGWVLADGSSATGSAYATLTGATIVPDLRGQVLRGKNNGRSDGQQNPDGDVALGTQQTDAYASHNHSASAAGGTGGSTLPWNNAGSVAFCALSSTGTSFQTNFNSNSGPQALSIAVSGGNESRMKNVTVNHFIRIN